jgi:hypothetical protein
LAEAAAAGFLELILLLTALAAAVGSYHTKTT